MHVVCSESPLLPLPRDAWLPVRLPGAGERDGRSRHRGAPAKLGKGRWCLLPRAREGGRGGARGQRYSPGLSPREQGAAERPLETRPAPSEPHTPSQTRRTDPQHPASPGPTYGLCLQTLEARPCWTSRARCPSGAGLTLGHGAPTTGHSAEVLIRSLRGRCFPIVLPLYR